MVGREGLKTEGLDLCFDKLMVFGGTGGIGGTKMGGGGMITEWKDIPMELLLRIISLVDDRTVIVASGVCSGWRDAICWGLTQLSLSWYHLIVSLCLCVWACVCVSVVCNYVPLTFRWQRHILVVLFNLVFFTGCSNSLDQQLCHLDFGTGACVCV